MKYQINKIIHTIPIIDIKTGLSVDYFRIFLNQVIERGLIIGTGSPVGAIEAQQGVEYMDEIGAPGAIKYIKQVADVGGDKTLGWVAIG